MNEVKSTPQDSNVHDDATSPNAGLYSVLGLWFLLFGDEYFVCYTMNLMGSESSLAFPISSQLS